MRVFSLVLSVTMPVQSQHGTEDMKTVLSVLEPEDVDSRVLESADGNNRVLQLTEDVASKIKQ